MNMNPRLDLELLVRRDGWRVPVLLALFAIAGALAYLAWHEQADEEQPALPVDGSRQMEQRLQSFRDILIDPDRLTEHQRDVLATALRHGLTVGSIDYGIESRSLGGFGIASLQMPLRGRYVDFRAFLSSILERQPELAIDDLSVQRLDGGSEVEAKLRLLFYTATAQRNSS